MAKRYRVLLGSVAMVAFVAVALLLLARQAGGWGVPYFSFTSAHGSPCTNDLTGYTCTPLTPDDVEFLADVDLPATTTVQTGRYRATHDYKLDADLSIPKASAAAGLKALQEAYGPCRKGLSSPLPPSVGKVCVMANEDGVEADGQLPSRLYVAATGVRRDGSRLVRLTIRSR